MNEKQIWERVLKTATDSLENLEENKLIQTEIKKLAEKKIKEFDK